jgi:hypothetical protein
VSVTGAGPDPADFGLPRDGLSAAIISSAKYFFLTLDPALLRQIRQTVLALGRGEDREALALAAAAAAAKGTELDGEALEDYAAAIDPGKRPGEEDARDRDRSRSEDGSGDRRHGEDHRESPGEAPGDLTGQGLRDMARQIDREGSLTGLLNGLPGKNGEYWLVYPFRFSSAGKEFRVSVRLSLRGERVSRLAVDILAEKRRWLFNLDSPGGPAAKAGISLYPPPSKRRAAKILREAGELLGEFGGPVSLMGQGLL